MSKEEELKTTATRWLEGFWGHAWNSKIVDDLAADDILPQSSLQQPRLGPEEAKRFQAGIREIFSALEFHRAGDLIVDGEYIYGRLHGGGTHTGSVFFDYLLGFLSGPFATEGTSRGHNHPPDQKRKNRRRNDRGDLGRSSRRSFKEPPLR